MNPPQEPVDSIQSQLREQSDRESADTSGPVPVPVPVQVPVLSVVTSEEESPERGGDCSAHRVRVSHGSSGTSGVSIEGSGSSNSSNSSNSSSGSGSGGGGGSSSSGGDSVVEQEEHETHSQGYMCGVTLPARDPLSQSQVQSQGLGQEHTQGEIQGHRDPQGNSQKQAPSSQQDKALRWSPVPSPPQVYNSPSRKVLQGRSFSTPYTSRKAILSDDKSKRVEEGGEMKAERSKGVERSDSGDLSPSMSTERHDYIMKLFAAKACKIMYDRRSEIEANGAFAALCVRDAFEGRLGNGLATNSTKSPFIFGVYSLQTDNNWMNLVILSSAFHTLLTYMEPGMMMDTCSDTDWIDQSYTEIIGPYLVYFHYLVWLIHATDAGMKVFYQGVKEYFNHDWQQLYFIAIALHFVDLCIFKHTYLTNPLRPVVGLLRDRRGRRFFSVVKLIIYQMQEFLMPLFAFVFIIAVGCVLTDADTSSHTLVYYGYNWLCLILTNDTFSRLFPDIESSTDILSALLIFLLMYFGQGFIVNVLLGATLETFRATSTKQIKKENLKRNQGLVKAFTVLDTHKSGRIQLAQFATFMQNWKPELVTEQVQLYYELASGGDQDGITVFQFMKLPDIMCYCFEKESIVTKQMDASHEYIEDLCKRLRPFCYNPVQRPQLLKLRDMLYRVKVFYYLNYADIFLFFIQVQDRLVIPSLRVSPSICNVINGMYVLELALELAYREGDLYSLLSGLDIFLGLFTAGILGIYGLNIITFVGLYPMRGDLAKLLFRSLRCCRILITNSELSAFLSSVVSVGPLFCENMVFGLVILYMHGMAGYLLFGSYLEIWATPITATVTVQKLFLPFDLLETMETTMENVHKMSIFFFFLYFLMSIIVSNLSLSIILEWHAQMYAEVSKPADITEKKKVSHEILFKTIKDRIVSRRANKKNPSFIDIAKAKELSTTFSRYRMYFRGQKADYRMKFVDEIEQLSAKDLKACQKYSSIDLASFSKLINRQQKDLTWETDFVEHARKDHSVHVIKPGTVFIVQGDPAVKCFLISSGTVSVEMTTSVGTTRKSTEEVLIGSINLVGSACLTPESCFQYTCRVEKEVECLIFTQESILHELDSDHAGQLLRMAHKTSSVLKELVSRKQHAKETQKNIQRRRRGSTSMLRLDKDQRKKLTKLF